MSIDSRTCEHVEALGGVDTPEEREAFLKWWEGQAHWSGSACAVAYQGWLARTKAGGEYAEQIAQYATHKDDCSALEGRGFPCDCGYAALAKNPGVYPEGDKGKLSPVGDAGHSVGKTPRTDALQNAACDLRETLPPYAEFSKNEYEKMLQDAYDLCRDMERTMPSPFRAFHTTANAARLLAFREAHCAGDHDEAWNAIYWLVSDNAADPFNPWTEMEALADPLQALTDCAQAEDATPADCHSQGGDRG